MIGLKRGTVKLVSYNQEWSELVDLSLNTIVKVENGVDQNPTIKTLTKIAKALGVPMEDLVK